jgi:type 1 glutamine amidotransferase
VISNFGSNAADGPEDTRAAFVQYMKTGGGFVSEHAADNSFGDWEEYNRMIGLGGGAGGRGVESGPYVYYSNYGELIWDDSPGKSGKHGARHEFPITVRVPDHPITKGMPLHWLISEDECYATLRGPAARMTILATGKDQSDSAPTDRHEPMLMVIDYEEGRVFHLTLGHYTPVLEGVGFIVSLQRGAEWAATGEVT